MHLQKTIYAMTLLIFLNTGFASAQQRPQTQDTVAHQIGFNLSPMLGNNDYSLPWLDYRYFYNSRRAFRFQFGMDGDFGNDEGSSELASTNSFSSSTVDSTISNGPSGSSLVVLRAGFLWYRNKGKDVFFYFGLEGQFKYETTFNQEHNIRIIRNGSNISTTDNNIKTRTWSHSYGAIPTFGVTWMPSSRFSLGIESGAGFIWTRKVTKIRSEFTTSSGPPATVNKFVHSKHVVGKSVNYGIDPLLGLIIGFRI